MTAVSKPQLTPAEYLIRERSADFRSEYFAGEMFAMAGASYEHNRITDNLVGALRIAFGGGPCYTLSRYMRVKVTATGLYTYPDVVILCGPPELEDAHGDTLLNPKGIVEVLSDSTSTEQYDRGRKFGHYRQLASLEEYVLVSQDRPMIERYVRQPDNTWNLKVFADPLGTFSLASVPAEVTLADVYRGVEFPSEEMPRP